MYHPDKDYLMLSVATRKFVWLPKRCAYTKKILWLTWAYCLEYDFRQDFSTHWTYSPAKMVPIPYHTPYWCSSKAYVFAKLKGEM